MAKISLDVIGGVDTHKHTHYAAVIDRHGRLLGDQEFPACDEGYRQLLIWMRSHGSIQAIGVEGTGHFGTTLTRFLTGSGERVVEVNRPQRQARRRERLPQVKVRGPRGDTDLARHPSQRREVPDYGVQSPPRSGRHGPLTTTRRVGSPDQANSREPLLSTATRNRRPREPARE